MTVAWKRLSSNGPTIEELLWFGDLTYLGRAIWSWFVTFQKAVVYLCTWHQGGLYGYFLQIRFVDVAWYPWWDLLSYSLHHDLTENCISYVLVWYFLHEDARFILVDSLQRHHGLKYLLYLQVCNDFVVFVSLDSLEAQSLFILIISSLSAATQGSRDILSKLVSELVTCYPVVR